MTVCTVCPLGSTLGTLPLKGGVFRGLTKGGACGCENVKNPFILLCTDVHCTRVLSAFRSVLHLEGPGGPLGRLRERKGGANA